MKINTEYGEALLKMLLDEPGKSPQFYADELVIKPQQVSDFKRLHREEIEKLCGGGKNVEAGRSEVEQLRENVVRLQNELNEALKREKSLKNDVKDANDKYNAKSVLCEQYRAKLEERSAQVADNRNYAEMEGKYNEIVKKNEECERAISELTRENEKLRHTLDASKVEYNKFEDDYLRLKRKADRYDELMNKFAAAYMKEHFGIEVEE